MQLEVDERLTLDQAREVFHACGFTGLEELDKGFSIMHAASGLTAYFSLNKQLRPVLAEGLVPPTWKSRSRVTFRYNNTNFDACAEETMRFARTLATASPAYFVLSFQFEEVYAVRDGKGLREITDPTSTMSCLVASVTASPNSRKWSFSRLYTALRRLSR